MALGAEHSNSNAAAHVALLPIGYLLIGHGISLLYPPDWLREDEQPGMGRSAARLHPNKGIRATEVQGKM